MARSDDFQLCIAGASNSNGRTEEGVGHNVDLPAEVLLDGNTVLSDHYAEVTGKTSWGNPLQFVSYNLPAALILKPQSHSKLIPLHDRPQ